MAYDYKQAIRDDVRDAIELDFDFAEIYTEHDGDLDEIVEYFNDELWTWDSVTGNGSGSYTFSNYEAEQNLVGNLDLLFEALCEFGYADEKLRDLCDKGAEWHDVTIRCYLLYGAVSEIVREFVEILEG